MQRRRATRLTTTMAVAALLAVVSGLFVPVQAIDEPASTATTLNTFELRDAAAMRAAGDTGEGVIGSTQAVPGAYRVCAPAKCVWVEATRYCPPTTGCGGGVVLGPWPGGYCSPSVGCVTMNGRQYKVTNWSTYNNKDADAVFRCAVGLGLIAANAWTRGYSQRALLGAGVTVWGCGDVAGG